MFSRLIPHPSDPLAGHPTRPPTLGSWRVRPGEEDGLDPCSPAATVTDNMSLLSSPIKSPTSVTPPPARGTSTISRDGTTAESVAISSATRTAASRSLSTRRPTSTRAAPRAGRAITASLSSSSGAAVPTATRPAWTRPTSSTARPRPAPSLRRRLGWLEARQLRTHPK